MAKKSNLTTSQRRQIVLSFIRKEEPSVQLARRWGISEATLYRWRDEFLQAGKQALNGKGSQSEQAKAVSRLNVQIAERDQVIGELTIANRIFKVPDRGSVNPSPLGDG